MTLFKRKINKLYLKIFFWLLLFLIVVLLGIYLTGNSLQETLNQLNISVREDTINKLKNISWVYIIVVLIDIIIYFVLLPITKRYRLNNRQFKEIILTMIDLSNFLIKGSIFSTIFFIPFTTSKRIISIKILLFLVFCILVLYVFLIMNHWSTLLLKEKCRKNESYNSNYHSLDWICIIILVSGLICLIFHSFPISFPIPLEITIIQFDSLLYIFLFLIEILTFIFSYFSKSLFKLILIPPTLDLIDLLLKTVIISPILDLVISKDSIYTPAIFWSGMLILFLFTVFSKEIKANLTDNKL